MVTPDRRLFREFGHRAPQPRPFIHPALTESLEELERTDPAVPDRPPTTTRMAFRFKPRRRLRERAEREAKGQ